MGTDWSVVLVLASMYLIVSSASHSPGIPTGPITLRLMTSNTDALRWSCVTGRASINIYAFTP